jgi:Protein of unknown function (DUF3285)
MTTNLENPESIGTSEDITPTEPTKPPGSYVKHAMRNMVRKRGKSLQHFFLSTAGLLALFVGLAYLTR